MFVGVIAVATATLDIFSGQPNPQWTLDAKQEHALVRDLRTLRRATTAPPAQPDLGYRGIRVRFAPARAGLREARLYGGMATLVPVRGAPRHVTDPDRRIETQVLDAGRAHLPSGLADGILPKSR